MALQDLTPQLRTRLSRLERVVGLFVTVATLLLLVGLGYYVYQTAHRKGWFLVKLPYFTFLRDAAGLRVGAPVKLMGFDVGQITQIEAMPPYDPYNVFVQFRVRSPYFGYLWEDSRVRVVAADFLGNRYLELTKGTNGAPTYLFNEFTQLPVRQAQAFVGNTNIVIGQDVFDATNNLVFPAKTPLTRENYQKLISHGIATVQIINRKKEDKHPTGIWDHQEAMYKPFTRDTKGYWLVADESPALTERLETVVSTVEKALPSFLGLTNRLASVLTNAADITSHADELLVSAKPVVTNLARISANLTAPQGSLGEWLLPTNINTQLQTTLQSANATAGAAQTNLNVLTSNLVVNLANLAGVTSNLNAQVQANGLILNQISDLIVHSDEMVQGLKRHWLLRGAFPATTNQPIQSIVKPTLGGEK